MTRRELLSLSSTLKKQSAGSSETLVMGYHSKQCHFPEHGNLEELRCYHGTRIMIYLQSIIIIIITTTTTTTNTTTIIHHPS